MGPTTGAPAPWIATAARRPGRPSAATRTAGTAYHWQAWAEDEDGVVSTIPPSGGSPDFSATANTAPGVPAAASQFHLDMATPIAVGGTTPETAVLCFAVAGDSDAGDAV